MPGQGPQHVHTLITVSSPARLQPVLFPPLITNILIRPRLRTSKAACRFDESEDYFCQRGGEPRRRQACPGDNVVIKNLMYASEGAGSDPALSSCAASVSLTIRQRESPVLLNALSLSPDANVYRLGEALLVGASCQRSDMGDRVALLLLAAAASALAAEPRQASYR
ncbi:hypothetical protein INR49_026048 [Caranx melampygus]|nr:hypothetical protein INR49_026048 [Caranx melampygus]